ncbi:MAG: hypothetical protein R3E01_27235 [Pirellulaceae bacterium]
MPRRPNRVPSYLLHKPSGQARVRINGVDVHLGSYNRPESFTKYRELVAKYPTPESRRIVLSDDAICVAELVAKYVEFAAEYYHRNRDEHYRIKSAITPLLELYGDLPVSDFSPKKLKTARQHIIDTGLSRNANRLSRSRDCGP